MEEKLPEGWAEATLGMLGEYINGYAFSDELWSKTGRPIIRIQDLTGTRNTPNYFDGEIEEKYLVHTGDFLIAWSATLGAFIWRGTEAWLNQHIFKVVSYIDKLFHYYLVQSVIDDLYHKAHGSGIVHVTRGIFESTEVPLPPLPEQHRIVSVIEQQFTRLDSATASLKNAKARVKQYRASLLKSAMEGELTREWRAEHPVSETGEQLLARILQERCARWEEEQLRKMREKGVVPKDDTWKEKYEEPQEPDVENLPELPEGWCWATVEQVSYVVRYGTSAKTSDNNTGVPVLRMGNIQDNALDFSRLKYLPIDHPEFPDLLLETGDLLFNRTNSADLVGKSAVYRGEFPLCSYASYLISVKLLIDYLADYLCFYINSYYGKVWIKSVSSQQAGQANVNGSKLQALVFPLPPLAEQAQIVAEVEAKLSNIEQLEATTENNLKRAERERQSILQEAFAGRLVPQDPNDEPASILLERIREERKKREEAEKVLKVGRKGSSMEAAKKRRAKKVAAGEAGIGLYEVLVEAGEPLRPEEVFRLVGLKTEDQPESVEAFYVELRADVADDLVGVIRPDTTTVLLEALDGSPEEEEEAAHMELVEDAEEEGELAVQLQKEDEKVSSEWPTLWDELDNE